MIMMYSSCLFLLGGSLLLRVGAAIKIDDCNSALGMEDGRILDDQITASSSFDEVSVGPHNARIRTERDGGAWCPKSQITQESMEWIQVDLGQDYLISTVETQGRFGGGLGKEYPPGYKIQYWRKALDAWVTFKDQHGKQIIKGNTNTLTAVERQLYSPIVASKIRLVPWSEFGRTVCLRLELYGCPYKGQLTSYSMPQGVHIGPSDLRDTAYDGLYDRQMEYLSDGLGLLYDGVTGGDKAMREDDLWVGWKAQEHGSTVELVLELTALSNVTALSLHCSNQFSNDAYVFANAHLFFSIDGLNYSNRIVDYTYLPDEMFETARWVKIPIPNRIARFIKIELTIYTKFLLISEIDVHSVPMSEKLDLSLVQKELENEDNNFESIPLTVVGSDHHSNGKYKKESVAVFTLNELPPAYIILIVGVCIIVATICAVIIAILYVRQRRQHKDELAAYAAAVYQGFATLPTSQRRNNSAAVKGHSLQRVKDMQVMFESSAGSTHHRVLPSASTFLMTVNNMENSLIEKLPPSSPPPKCPLPVSPPPEYHSHSDESSEYAEPDTPHKSCAEIPLLPPPPASARRRPAQRHFNEAHQSADNVHYDSVTVPSALHPSLNFLQGLRGSMFYDCDEQEPSTSTFGVNYVEEIPKNRLQFREKLGEGEFGEVHLCSLDLGRGKCKPVAVKILRQEASSNAVQDFDKELHVLSKLNDRNVVRLIGCCRGEQPCMIVEYVENGDLHRYINAHHSTITQNQLLHMAAQIASGMKYLESVKLVHRDLATRNCLVGEDMTIKIADFGMARSLYSSDYYHIDGNFVLPIRWMAWECILMANFSSQSDMWAFGVTLWEMFSLCQLQPFAHMSDQEVIDNMQHMYHHSKLAVYLAQPADCPRELYDLMHECWRRDGRSRPTFTDITLFLQRKTLPKAAILED